MVIVMKKSPYLSRCVFLITVRRTRSFQFTLMHENALTVCESDLCIAVSCALISYKCWACYKTQGRTYETVVTLLHWQVHVVLQLCTLCT